MVFNSAFKGLKRGFTTSFVNINSFQERMFWSKMSMRKPHSVWGSRGLKPRITNLISGCRFVSSGQIILENKRFFLSLRKS